MPLDPTRRERITASMAPQLMAGDAMVLQRLFLRAIGDPRYEDDGFSSSWIARYGLAVEPLALDWHEEKTGHELTLRGEQVFHPCRPYVSATLDAYRPHDSTVLDVKCINAHRDIDDAVAYYCPQLVVQKECARAERAALLIVRGGAAPQEVAAEWDGPYQAAVWDAIDRFWQCVENLTPPVPLQFPRVVPPEQWRSIDLDRVADQPNWAGQMRELLISWDDTETGAKAHEAAKEAIKKLLPDDCGRLTFSCYAIARSKSNAVSIKRR